MTLKPYKPKGESLVGLTHVAVKLKNTVTEESYVARFLVDTGTMDAMAPASELRKIGIQPKGTKTYELASGELVEYQYGFAEILLLGTLTVSEVVFGPEDTEPILGVIALESAGYLVDPKNQRLRKLRARPLKAIPLKSVA
jgi:clan AA aspartic protease